MFYKTLTSIHPSLRPSVRYSIINDPTICLSIATSIQQLDITKTRKITTKPQIV